jgi:hypothetical protein
MNLFFKATAIIGANPVTETFLKVALNAIKPNQPTYPLK